MLHLFYEVSEECSKVVTKRYSTSFSSAIRLLHKDLRAPVFNIYGFVRFADEIVDTFHSFDKRVLLNQFKEETFTAINRGISLNPVLNSFQKTVNTYRIDHKLINAFFASMEIDLEKQVYDPHDYHEYIYGSAEIVGLMCLYIFCEGNDELYRKLESYARSLGAAFQKVNFLRDVKADYNGLSRTYFPGCDFANFNFLQKQKIEEEIHNDFKQAYKEILQLPLKARFSVYVAYKYYLSLFKKIKRTRPARILESRISIPAYTKAMIVVRARVKNQLRLI